MARKALIVKAKRTPKYSTRVVRRCWRCGRNHGYMRDFNMCRICFRELAENGDLPGVTRSSW
jgi:small subunit ribosomal protein S14